MGSISSSSWSYSGLYDASLHASKLCVVCSWRQATCRAHPNQRKVYAAVLGKLLPNLLAAGFGEASAPGEALHAAARQLLTDVVFHSSHVKGASRALRP